VKYDFCRLFVETAGAPREVERWLLARGGYGSAGGVLVSDGVWIDVRRNENPAVEGSPGFLTWPVTMEVFRDEDGTDVSDADMLAVVRRLKLDLADLPARVVVASEFEDEV
jgi:hypothetical protein